MLYIQLIKRIRLIHFAVIFFLIIFQFTSLASGLDLYLASNNELSSSVQNNTASTPIQPGIGIAIAKLVGTWHSKPIGGNRVIKENVNASLWAKGEGIQREASFIVYLGVNDQRGEKRIETNKEALSSTPKEYKGSGIQNLNLNKGDKIGLWIYAVERGSGGELLYGGEYQSKIELPTEEFYYSYGSSVTDKIINVSGEVSYIWGSEEIESIEVIVAKLLENGSMDEKDYIDSKQIVYKKAAETKIKNDSIEFKFGWEYYGKVKSGKYIIILEVKTKDGDFFYLTTSTTLKGRIEEAGISPLSIGIVAIIIILLALFAFFYFYKGMSIIDKIPHKKIFALVICLLLVLSICVYAYISFSGERKAPNFSLKDTDGKELSLSELSGKVVLLDFMSLKCPACKKMIGTIKAIHEKFKDLVIISIDVDPSESLEELKKYKEEEGAHWSFAMDTEKLSEKYGVIKIPKIVIINGDGYITFMGEGEIKKEKLEDEIGKAIAGKGTIITFGTTSLFLLAFLAGISSFFSPCAFPLLPGYITYYLGSEARTGYKRGFIFGSIAAFGILSVYLVFALIISLFGAAVSPYVSYLGIPVAIILIILGIIMLTNFVIPIPSFQKPKFIETNIDKLFGEEKGGFFLYGIGYGFASLACQAPIFLAVVLGAILSGGFISGFLAFFLYALAMGIFMVLFTIFVSKGKEKIISKMKNLMNPIKKGSGIVLIIIGIYLVWYYYTTI
ncbi:MAG: cytochrome c biogenesis protein CcdA [Candidatus Thermoplasmatota archaeon]